MISALKARSPEKKNDLHVLNYIHNTFLHSFFNSLALFEA